MSAFSILPAETPEDLQAITALFEAYGNALDVDLTLQDFAGEVASLPGKYAAPHGALLLARSAQGVPIGCVALRPSTPVGYCEMKRLYVSPEARGLGLGEALARAIMRQAEAMGYRAMHLDTLPSMPHAIALYRKLGFTPIAPYYDSPLPDPIFLGRALATPTV